MPVCPEDLLDTVSDGSPSSMQQRTKALVSFISFHLIARLLHLVLHEGQVGVQVGVQGIAYSLVAQSCQAHNSPCVVAESVHESSAVGGEGGGGGGRWGVGGGGGGGGGGSLGGMLYWAARGLPV